MSDWIQVTEWLETKDECKFAIPLLGKDNIRWEFRKHLSGQYAIFREPFKDTKRAYIGGDAGSEAKG